MFSSSFRGVNAYAQVGLETRIAAASPHQLITMLFEGAMTAITHAMQQMSEGDIPAKGKSISHALSIIESGLRGGLDDNKGGEVTANLDALYVCMEQRLLQANLENNQEKLKEVYRLLSEIKTAWESIDPCQPPPLSDEHSEPPMTGSSLPLMQRFAEITV